MHPIYYDATLTDANDAGLVLEYQGRILNLPTFQPVRDWLRGQVGQVGVVQFVPESECWRFNAYLDQSLRRVFEFDQDNRIGWRNDASPNGWTAPRCIVPGKDGAFIESATEELTIDIPYEFFELCNLYKGTPESVLRAFIADACEIKNYVSEPRADGYNSNGSDERTMAVDYLDRAYGMFVGQGHE